MPLYNLIKQAQRGDGEAFLALMEPQKLPMYKAAKAILQNDEDVADAIQETLLAAYKNIPRLQKPPFFKTWLTRILINKCYDIRKKNQMYVSSEILPERAEEDKNLTALTEDILEDVSHNYRLVLSLYYGMGFSVREIAAMLGLKESTVKTRLSRGREAVRKTYEEEMEAHAL